MKKVLLALGLLTLVSACASDGCSGGCGMREEYQPQPEVRTQRTYRTYKVENYAQPQYVEAPQVVRAPCGQVQGGCQPQVRTVREPVEVVYKNVTYRTVYEPRTTSSVEYSRQPYQGEKVEQVVQQPVAAVAAPCNTCGLR